jgi:hypothetical protein
MRGVSRRVSKNGIVPGDDPQLASHLDVLRREASHALPSFASTLVEMGVTSSETRIVDDDAGDGHQSAGA